MDFATIAAQLNAGIILPEGIILATLVLVLLIDLISGRSAAQTLPYVAIGGLLLALVALYYQWDVADPVAFLGEFNGDAMSIAFRGIIALSTTVTILMSIRYVQQAGTSLAEFIGILLSATLGGMFLSGANELVAIFVSLETLSI